MRTFTKTAAALGLILAILAGPGAEDAQAELVTGALITGAALAGGYGGAIVGSKIGIAALGTAVSGTVPVAIVGAAGGAITMKALTASISAAAAKAGLIAVTPVALTAGGVWVVAGATVVIAAVLVYDRRDAIIGAAQDAARAVMNGIKTAAVWTADIGVAGFEATWDGMKWTAGATAVGSAAAWEWTADVASAGATATWSGAKTAGRATARGTAAAWNWTSRTAAAGWRAVAGAEAPSIRPTMPGTENLPDGPWAAMRGGPAMPAMTATMNAAARKRPWTVILSFAEHGEVKQRVAAGGAGAAMKLERSQSQAALSAAEEAAERYLNRAKRFS